MVTQKVPLVKALVPGAHRRAPDGVQGERSSGSPEGHPGGFGELTKL